MSDYLVRAIAANGRIRAFAAVTTQTVEKARISHNTSPVVTAALGRLLTAGLIMGSMMKNEKDMLPVSFGAMLLESMLAVIALIAVASFASGEAAAQGWNTPAQIFAGAVSNFLTTIGLPSDIVYTLITLSISAFALTSLDSVARVGRLSFQELFLDDSITDENMGKIRKVLTNKRQYVISTGLSEIKYSFLKKRISISGNYYGDTISFRHTFP